LNALERGRTFSNMVSSYERMCGVQHEGDPIHTRSLTSIGHRAVRGLSARPTFASDTTSTGNKTDQAISHLPSLTSIPTHKFNEQPKAIPRAPKITKATPTPIQGGASRKITWMDTWPIQDLPEALRTSLPPSATSVKPQDHKEIREAIQQGHGIFRRTEQVTWKILLHNHGRRQDQHHVVLNDKDLAAPAASSNYKTLQCSKCDGHLQCRDIHSVDRFTAQRCDHAQPGLLASTTAGRNRTLQNNLKVKYLAYNKTQQRKLATQRKPWTHAVEIYPRPDLKRGWAIRCMRCDDDWGRADDRAAHEAKDALATSQRVTKINSNAGPNGRVP